MRERAARHAVQVERGAEPLERAARSALALRRPAHLRCRRGSTGRFALARIAAARVDARGSPRRARRRRERARGRQVGVVGHVHQEVERHLEEHRPRHVRLRDAERGVDVLGDASRLGHLHAPLRDGAHQRRRGPCPGASPCRGAAFGPAPPMHDERDAGALRVRDRGDDVGDAGARGDGAHAGPPGHARVAVGRVAGGLLVAHVDDADALVEAAVVDRLDVPAAEREEVRRAVPLERLRDEPTAVHECHGLRILTTAAAASSGRLSERGGRRVISGLGGGDPSA